MMKSILYQFHFRWKCAVLCVLLGINLSAQAETDRLSEVIHQIWSGSQLLSSQTDQLQLAEFDKRWRYLPNEPQLQYSNNDDGTSYSYGLSLTTGFPGKVAGTNALTNAKIASIRGEVSARRYELAKTVVDNYLDCATAVAQEKLQQQTATDVDATYRTLKVLYENGHVTLAEKIGAELQARQTKLDLKSMQDKKYMACEKLHKFMELYGVKVDAAEFDKIELPEDLSETLLGEIGEVTASQARAKVAQDTAEASYKTAYASQLPDITLAVNRNHYVAPSASPTGKDWTTTYSMSVTVPILYLFHEDVEAKRIISQSRIDKDLAQQQLIEAESESVGASREFKRSRSRLREITGNDIPLAQALMQSTFSAYRSGKLGFAELVLARRTLTDLQSQEVMLRASIVSARMRCLKMCVISDS